MRVEEPSSWDERHEGGVDVYSSLIRVLYFALSCTCTFVAVKRFIISSGVVYYPLRILQSPTVPTYRLSGRKLQPD